MAPPRPRHPRPGPAHRTRDPGERQWPPADATALTPEDVHERLAAGGTSYPPELLECLTGVWEHAGEYFTEVRLPDELADQADGFGLHPALLDAALRPLLGPSRAPLRWRGVRLHAVGAREVRARVIRTGHG
ncbi:polyketide synthase dehydratase domain-containing protein [Streptomyces diastatochromogenes]|nr:polyketide synthase dehydratase domain-containing protein [Streptomyces diastatochromogenes]